MKLRLSVNSYEILILIVFAFFGLISCEQAEIMPLETFEEIVEEGHVMTWNITYMPRRFYPSMTLSDEEKHVVTNLYEGLTRTESGEVVMGMANAITISEDQLTYKVELRYGQWSDAKRVTTDDFVYSWERDDNYLNGINLLYYDAYIDKIKALDESTFEIVLFQPNEALLEQLSTVAFMPVRRDVIDLNKEIPMFISDVTNGPYYLKSYRMFTGITLTKNKHYYDFFEVKIDEIYIRLSNDFASVYNHYKEGSIDFVQGVEFTQIDDLMQYEDAFKIYDRQGVYAFAVNSYHEALRDQRIRRMLTLTIDRYEINPFESWIDNSIAYSVIDHDMIEAHADSNDVTEPYYPIMKPYIDIDKVRGIEVALGTGYLEALNGITLVTRDNPNDIHIAELLAKGWKDYLGIDIVIKAKDRYDYAYALKHMDYDLILNNHYHQNNNIRHSLKMYLGDTVLNDTAFDSYTYDVNLTGNYTSNDLLLYNSFKKASDELDKSTKMIPLFKLYEPVIISESIKKWTRSYEGMYYFGRAVKTVTDKEAVPENESRKTE